ncbi:hypothetical protein AL536_00245 [Vibrio fluvialis]|uniref:Nucleoside recognition n=1 Tax=Vibrio fluvialis TaxID=676 RepID=A0AAX2LWS3_VIBFL|nr:nucleoside recognition domain-containing protein [Vibrio fluvialis]AMF91958.1 hypothetical protein AL536_00245 [Vibrio fluvialis]EKO4010534.1 hypothetical protein [Vibrio fluvialis]MBY8228632.1 hypothetical protein [Vibrio fluvialis]MCE7632197.1 hypothetical protein [Vibrio fluvialis]SUQ26753.1 Nucleoside recognition [Vibrio fluvialis]
MLEFIKNSLIKTVYLWGGVMKLMIPIAIAVKILEVFGAINYLGELLEPVMISVGLPGVLGLVWAVALITNLWTAALVFVTVSSGMEITSAEATTLGIMMLFAHGLPLEIRMAQKCGVSAFFSCFLRVGGAIITAYLFNWIFTTYDLLQEQAMIYISQTRMSQSTYSDWVLGQLQSYVIVFLMLLALTLVLDLLKHFGLVHKLGEILSPYFKLMGLSKKCAPITLVGMTLGLVYGGALLLKEVDSGDLDEDDVILSITSMNLFHSIIEDTIIIFMMGGVLIWVLFVRFILTVIVMNVISQLLKFNSDFFWKIIKA